MTRDQYDLLIFKYEKGLELSRSEIRALLQAAYWQVAPARTEDWSNANWTADVDLNGIYYEPKDPKE